MADYSFVFLFNPPSLYPFSPLLFSPYLILSFFVVCLFSHIISPACCSIILALPDKAPYHTQFYQQSCIVSRSYNLEVLEPGACPCAWCLLGAVRETVFFFIFQLPVMTAWKFTYFPFLVCRSLPSISHYLFSLP